MVSPGVPNMAMVNVNNFLNVKDSRWLQLEVCREFQRNKCTRPDTECKFAHPPPNVEVQNGRVTACYDSIKGRCNREKPPCKYFHPPQHLKDQLLINGRNHLALKNAIMTQIQGLSPGTPVVPGTIPLIQPSHLAPTSPLRPPTLGLSSHEACCVIMGQHNSAPYLPGIPTMSNFNPYIASSPVMTMGVTDGAVASPITGVVPQQAVVPAQKVPRTDRLEVCREFQRGACKRPEVECRFAHPPDHVCTSDEGTVTVCMDAVKSRCSREPCRYFHPPPHLQAQLRASQGRVAHHQAVPGAAVAAAAAAVPLAPPPPLPAAAAAAAAELGKKRGRDPGDELLMAFPGMGVPYKRPAGEKSGMPVYQPTGSAAYQQALMQQLSGQSFVPVSCEYGGGVALPGPGGQVEGHDTTTSTTTSTAANNHHAAASSAQPPTTSSPTPTTTTTSSPPSSSKALHSSSSSSSSSSSVGGGELVPASPVALGSQQPVNVFYTGYALSKGLRPQMRAPASHHGSAIMAPMHHPMTAMGFAPPALPSSTLSSFSPSMGAPITTLSMPPFMSSSQQLMSPAMTTNPLAAASMGMGLGGAMHPSLGGLTAGISPSMGGMTGMTGLGTLGAGMPLMMPQTHMSSLYPSQYTSLPSNTAFAQGGEQPSKRLKTS
ncbi:muscleblind-like protein 1 isoform X3 [Portunus trituberculatus]|uniref:muscleblind-like protein 1 isoform X3 n=1 Tax=Portunus trituberculatus TaxID=210409 RepID=UPI001E1D10DF|nr:muscleblind-like protein 1 isoform X3 [Portunus trituberculatus]